MKPTIVIIDDNEKFAEVINSYLVRSGYNVIGVFNHYNYKDQILLSVADITIVSYRESDHNTFETLLYLKRKHSLKILVSTSVSKTPDLKDIEVGGVLAKTDCDPRTITEAILAIERELPNSTCQNF